MVFRLKSETIDKLVANSYTAWGKNVRSLKNPLCTFLYLLPARLSALIPSARSALPMQPFLFLSNHQLLPIVNILYTATNSIVATSQATIHYIPNSIFIIYTHVKEGCTLFFDQNFPKYTTDCKYTQQRAKISPMYGKVDTTGHTTLVSLAIL